jgi:hypothetical protein
MSPTKKGSEQTLPVPRSRALTMKFISHFETYSSESRKLPLIERPLAAFLTIVLLCSVAKAREKQTATLKRPSPVSVSTGKGLVSCIRQVSPSDEVAEDTKFGDVHILEDRVCPKKSYFFVTAEATHTLDLSSFCAELDKKGEKFEDRRVYFTLAVSEGEANLSKPSAAGSKIPTRWMRAKLLRLPRTNDLVLIGSEVIAKEEVRTNDVLSTSMKALSKSARTNILTLINSKVQAQLAETPQQDLLEDAGEFEQEEVFREDRTRRSIEEVEKDSRVSDKARVQARATAKDLSKQDFRKEYWRRIQSNCSPFLYGEACSGLANKGFPCKRAWWSQFADVATK